MVTVTMQSIRTAVDATNRSFEKAFKEGDAAAAVAVYSSDGKAFPPNSPTVSGRAALQNFWQAVMDMGVKAVTLETVEFELCGDNAYEVGKAVLFGAGGAVLDRAKFIVVWKEEDGAWKWHRDIWNSELPA